jgi:hypothetical protein
MKITGALLLLCGERRFVHLENVSLARYSISTQPELADGVLPSSRSAIRITNESTPDTRSSMRASRLSIRSSRVVIVISSAVNRLSSDVNRASNDDMRYCRSQISAVIVIRRVSTHRRLTFSGSLS